MSHGLLELDHAMFGSNRPAWHGLGTVVEGNPTTAEAIRIARLDWEVAKEPAFFDCGGGRFAQADRCFLTVRTDLQRDDSRRVLGHVGETYEPIQNAEAFEILDELCGEGGARIETAGSLDNGRRIFATAKLPESVKVKDDTVDRFMVLATSHDGTMALTAFFTPIRVVCQNTLRWALQGATSKASIRHTKNAKGRILEAQRVLGIATEYFDKQSGMMNHLAEKSVGPAFVEAYLKVLIPDPIGASAKHAKKTRYQIAELFVNRQAGAFQDATRGTAYGLANAVAEYVDHVRPSRGFTMRDKAESRFKSVIHGTGAAMKERAVEILLECIDTEGTARAAAAEQVLAGIDFGEGKSGSRPDVDALLDGIELN